MIGTQQVTAIALRLFVIWVLVELVINAPAILVSLSWMEKDAAYLSTIWYKTLVLLLYAGMGLLIAFLIFRSSKGVLKLTRDSTSTTATSDLIRPTIQILGVYFLVDGLSYLPTGAAFYLIPDDAKSYPGSGLILASLVEISAGLHLIYKPSWWTEGFSKIRNREDAL